VKVEHEASTQAEGEASTPAERETSTPAAREVRPAASGSVPRRSPWRALLVTARPRQWIKNLLVLAVPAAAGALDDGGVIGATALAFVAFCLASAGTYLLNDVADRDADRLHPVKRRRPVAAGELSTATATPTAAALLAGACVVGWLADPGLGAVVAAYVALTTAYSRGLKHVAIFDIATVASGFFLRAVAVTAEQASTTAGAILDLRERHRALIQDGGLGVQGLRLLDLLFQRPLVHVQLVSQLLGVTFPTANKLVGQLERSGVMTETTGGQRNRRYRYDSYLTLLDPPNKTPEGGEDQSTGTEDTPVEATESRP